MQGSAQPKSNTSIPQTPDSKVSQEIWAQSSGLSTVEFSPSSIKKHFFTKKSKDGPTEPQDAPTHTGRGQSTLGGSRSHWAGGCDTQHVPETTEVSREEAALRVLSRFPNRKLGEESRDEGEVGRGGVSSWVCTPKLFPQHHQAWPASLHSEVFARLSPARAHCPWVTLSSATEI